MSKYIGFTQAVDRFCGKAVKGFFLVCTDNSDMARTVLGENKFMTSASVSEKGLVGRDAASTSFVFVTAKIPSAPDIMPTRFDLDEFESFIGVSALAIHDRAIRKTLDVHPVTKEMLFLSEKDDGEICVFKVIESDIDERFAEVDPIRPVLCLLNDLSDEQRDSLSLSYPEHADLIVAKKAITIQNEVYSF